MRVLVDTIDPNRFVFGGGWEHLHNADSTSRGATGLVELRFLIALRHQHQVIEGVGVAVFAEDFDERLETLDVGGRIGAFEDLVLLEEAKRDDPAGRSRSRLPRCGAMLNLLRLRYLRRKS